MCVAGRGASMAQAASTMRGQLPTPRSGRVNTRVCCRARAITDIGVFTNDLMAMVEQTHRDEATHDGKMVAIVVLSLQLRDCRRRHNFRSAEPHDGVREPRSHECGPEG